MPVATATAEHAANLDASPAGPIWLTPRAEGRRRLIDLTLPPPGGAHRT